jgi:hypothetical protein
METAFELLTQRVDRLERQNRWLRRLLGCIFGAASAILLIAAQKEKLQTVETDKFVLRDANGKARFQMEVGKEGPLLRFLDERGTDVATLGGVADAMVMRFFEPRNRLTSGLALQKNGVALVYYDRDGKAQTGRNAILLGTGIFPSE